VIGIGGLFLINSVLMYDKLVQVDDEINSNRGTGHNGRGLSLWQHPPALTTPKQRVLTEYKTSKSTTSRSASASKRHRFVRGTPSSSHEFKPLSVLQKFRQHYPPSDNKRIQKFVHSVRDHDFDKRQRNDLPYDVYDCPDQPPVGYPMAWAALDLLDHWGVDDTTLPKTPIFQGLCVFDWETQQTQAEAYREKELPFVVKNHPGVMETTERWMMPGFNYLSDLLKNEPQRSEHGPGNHLMFWRTLSPVQQMQFPEEKNPDGWEPPTDFVDLSYDNWLEKAKALENDTDDQTKEEHFYLRLTAFHATNKYLYDELPFFDPERHADYLRANDPNAFLMVDAREHRGINCRFGQRGTIAEMHFDSTRNFVVLLGGQRRYILAHPDQCSNVDLYERIHPSGRHSKVNWSNPTDTDSASSDKGPPLSKAKINEVVLQAGDILVSADMSPPFQSLIYSFICDYLSSLAPYHYRINATSICLLIGST